MKIATMERAEGNEGVAHVQQNTSDEGTRVQHPAGIKNAQGQPEHDTQVLGDVSRRVLKDLQDRKPDDGVEVV